MQKDFTNPNLDGFILAASVGRRFIAEALDLSLPTIFCVASLSIIITWAFPIIEGDSDGSGRTSVMLVETIWFSVSSITVLYSLISESIHFTTPGKWLLQCRTLNVNGFSVSRKTLLLRSAIKHLPLIILMVVIMPIRWVVVQYPFTLDGMLLTSIVVSVGYSILDVVLFSLLCDQTFHDILSGTSVFCRSNSRGFEVHF